MTNLAQLTLWLMAVDQFSDEVFELGDAFLYGWLQTDHPWLFRATCKSVHIPNGLHGLRKHTRPSQWRKMEYVNRNELYECSEVIIHDYTVT